MCAMKYVVLRLQQVRWCPWCLADGPICLSRYRTDVQRLLPCLGAVSGLTLICGGGGDLLLGLAVVLLLIFQLLHSDLVLVMYFPLLDSAMWHVLSWLHY